jgi:hypothetical protein
VELPVYLVEKGRKSPKIDIDIVMIKDEEEQIFFC